MRRWSSSQFPPILLVIALVAGCSSPIVGEPDRWPPDEEVGLAYRITLSSGGVNTRADVLLAVRADHGGQLATPLEFLLPCRWAGGSDLHLDLTGFWATGPGGEPLPVIQEGERVLISHPGLSRLTLGYRVAPRARSLTRRSRFRAVGTPEWFFGYGRNLLARPALDSLESAPAYLELAASRREAVWATTLGVFREASGVIRRPLSDLLDAAYLGGRIRVVSLVQGEESFTLAVDPRLGQVEDDLLVLGHRLVTYTAANLPELPWRATVGLLLHRADGPGVMTGSGRPGGFVLELGETEGWESNRAALLIAHENLHQYIGNWLRFALGQELSTMWFLEGVVEYLSVCVVIRSGVASSDLFLQVLSQMVTGYLSNRFTDSVGGESSEERFWEHPGIRQLDYQKGFLLAFWLDIQLRRAQDRLEGAVGQLLRSFAGSRRIGNEEIRRVLEERLGRDLHEWFTRYVTGQERVPVTAWLEEAGLGLRRQLEEVAYLGLETAVDRDGRFRIVGIDPMGPAAGFPLRVGDILAAPPSLPSRGPQGRARLVVLGGGERREFFIPCQAGHRVRWEAYRIDSRFDRLMGW
ncbi:MAG: hypothetical protein JW797_11475 [Bradymonadales bacterium]|nr:hypothetical protein [Bradymonadales bacterium]